MKKIIIYTLLFMGSFFACKKQEYKPVLGNTDERLTKELANYKTQLTGAEFGWKGILIAQDKHVLFALSFTDDNRVNMLADINDNTAVKSSASSYRLKGLQQPVLLFDTYSYLHLTADPDPGALDGEQGKGYFSDFEFVFISASADTIKLEGTFNKSKLTLIRVKAKNEAENSIAANMKTIKTLSNLKTYFKRMTIEGKEYEIKLNPFFNNQFIEFKKGDSEFSKSSFYVEGDKITLTDPFIDGATTIAGISDISYDGNVINGKVQGKPVQLKEATKPLEYDTNAGQDFFNNAPNNSYWCSYDGFTVDEIPDIYKITTIPDFVFMVFWPKNKAMGGDVLDCVILSDKRIIMPGYGSIFTTDFPADGRIAFTYKDSFIPPPPAFVKSIMGKVTSVWTDPEGFYAIKTGYKAYDLVSAKDARSWIHFERQRR